MFCRCKPLSPKTAQVLPVRVFQSRYLLFPAYPNATATMRPVTKVRILGLRLGIVVLACYWIVIFTGTHVPVVPRMFMAYNDKIKHFGAYFGLAFLLCYVTSGDKPWSRFGSILALAAVYGAIDELTQSLVPGRTTDFLDWGADMLGAATAISLYIGLRLFSQKSTYLNPIFQ